MANKAEIVVTAVDSASAKLVAIGARLDALARPVARVSNSFAGLYKAAGLSDVQAAVGKFGGRLRDLAAVGAAGVAVLGGVAVATMNFAKRSVDAADAVGDLAERYQTSSQTIQVYGSLLEEAGGSVEDAAVSIGKLRKAITEANAGGKEQLAAFQGIGISAAELRDMKPEEVLLRMADAFKASTNENAKQAVALTTMGKNGTVMISTLNQGAEGIQARFKQMREEGALFTEEQMRIADQGDKAFSRMGRTFDSLRNSLGLQLAEKLIPLVDQITKWAIANRALISSKFDEFLQRLPEIISTVRDVLGALWAITTAVVGAFRSVVNVLGPTGTLIAGLALLLAPSILAFGSLAFAVYGVVAKLALLAAPAALTGITSLTAAIGVSNVAALGLLKSLGLVAAAGAAGWAVGTMLYDNIDLGFGDMLQRLNGNEAAVQAALAPTPLRSTAGDYARTQSQNIKNTLDIHVTAEGQAKVREVTAGSDATEINVSSGLLFAGGA